MTEMTTVTEQTTKPLPKIYICYRWQDAADATENLVRELLPLYTEAKVFYDKTSIPPGTEFHEVLSGALRSCGVLLVVIGPNWLTMTDERGKRCLTNVTDPVRKEIITGLDRHDREGLVVIPVLVKQAKLPRRDDLPDQLQPLIDFWAHELHEDGFRGDVNRLIGRMNEMLQIHPKELPSDVAVPSLAVKLAGAGGESERLVSPAAVTGGADVDYDLPSAVFHTLGGPFWRETGLNRSTAHGVATQRNELHTDQQFASTPSDAPDASRHHPADVTDQRMQLFAMLAAAHQAYFEAGRAYSQTAAPAVWAEIQRRQGDLYLMETRLLLPVGMTTRPVPEPSNASPSPLALAKALEAAKSARDHYVAALEVFSPLYLPESWSRAQFGLASALLLIARMITANDATQARSLYVLCLAVITSTSQLVDTPRQSPLDWVDLQLLRAEADIGIASLGDDDAAAQYEHAYRILQHAASLLNSFERLPGNLTSERITTQYNIIESLRQEIMQGRPDS